MILSAALTAKILNAIQAVIGSNNGYADIGNDAGVADALTLAGFTIIATTDLHGKPVMRAFTARAQKALAVEDFGISTYQPVAAPLVDEPDYEAMILAQQSSYLQ